MMQLCKDHRLEWIATFKEGSLPQAYDEFETLTGLAPENRLAETGKGVRREYRWVGDLQHTGQTFSAFECAEW
jgi:hypothetical protein